MKDDEVRLNKTGEQVFSVNMGDVTISFGQLGINKITHPVLVKNNTENHAPNTDWVSPYQAGLIIDGERSGEHYSVSGNHGTSGGGGHATANTVSTKLTVDGAAIDDAYMLKGKKIVATVINHVTTKENINLTTGVRNGTDFIETVTYTFEHNHMATHVSLKAVNDFYINWYMGLQATNAYNTKVFYTHDTAKPLVYTNTGSQIRSGTKSQSPDMTRASLLNKNDEIMHVYIDKDYGIGYDHIGNNDAIAYLRESYLKFYYHLVKTSNPLDILAGQTKSYRGGYIFSKKEGTNAYVSRFVENGAKKAFVDFRTAATEQIEYTSIEESVNVTGKGTSLTASTNNAYAKVVI